MILGAASELAAPILRPLANAAARGRRTEPDQWRNGLIIGHNHIGDVLYRTPSLPMLRQELPNCAWSYLTSPTSAEVLSGNPNIAKVLSWSSGLDSWSIDASHRQKLARRGFDVVLCTNTLRHYPDLLMAVRLGIPNRVGFTHKGLSAVINHPVPIEFPSPFPAYFRSMVAGITREQATWPLIPQIFLNDADYADGRLAFDSIAPRRDKPMLACALTARQGQGNWPLNSMISVIREARKLADFTVLLSGVKADVEQLNGVARELQGDVRVMAGEVSLRGFAALLTHCAALFSLDSGPRHIANAVGTPVVFARNLWASAVETGKYCDNETDIVPPGEYLTEEQIADLAALTPVAAAAKVLASTVAAGASRA